MQLFGETVEMLWELDAEEKYHGHGYGIGENHIFVGEFIHGALWGDLLMFDRVTGRKMLKVEMEDNMAHGSYEYYHRGEVVEVGVYRNGSKYFMSRLRYSRVFEYGFTRDDRLHGYGVTEKNGRIYTSADWKDGMIDGLGIVQDQAGEVIFYGRFKCGEYMEETDEKPTCSNMIHLWKEALQKKYYRVPYECAMVCLC